jgi:hypothetical protein
MSAVLAVALCGAAALAFAAPDWSGAERAFDEFRSEHEQLRRLTPAETGKIVDAVCEAEEDERQSVARDAAQRVRGKIEDEYEALQKLEEKARVQLDAVLADAAHKDRHGKAKEYRAKVTEWWASIEKMTRSLRGANHALPVAEILTRPCFAELRRVALETDKGRVMRHSATSRERVQALIQDPACDMVNMDSGRHEELVAAARIETGLLRDASYWNAFPAPLMSTMVVPHEASLTEARLEAFCELAVTLRALAGCTSVEMDFGKASSLSLGQTPTPRKGLIQPGMTLRRLQERRSHSYSQRASDRQIPSPEWGLFLGRGHLDQVSAGALAASGAFHDVRRLGDDLAFLQLTADPMDALRPDYDELLEPARRALAPLLSAPIVDD